MVAALSFLLISIPLAYAMDRLVGRLTWAVEIPDSAVGRKLLFWQTEPLASRLRLALSASAPLLLAMAFIRFEPLPGIAVALVLLALLVCSATDLLCYRIPDAVTYPALAVALLAAVILPDGDVSDAALGALGASALFLPVHRLSDGGIALADAKFAILIGGVMGLERAFNAIVLGVGFGALVLLALLASGRVSRRQVTPYAPFLATGALVVLFQRGTAFAPLP